MTTLMENLVDNGIEEFKLEGAEDAPVMDVEACLTNPSRPNNDESKIHQAMDRRPDYSTVESFAKTIYHENTTSVTLLG